MTVPDQTTERRACATHFGSPIASATGRCSVRLYGHNTLDCVPSFLVPVERREAEQAVIEAAKASQSYENLIRFKATHEGVRGEAAIEPRAFIALRDALAALAAADTGGDS